RALGGHRPVSRRHGHDFAYAGANARAPAGDRGRLRHRGARARGQGRRRDRRDVTSREPHRDTRPGAGTSHLRAAERDGSRSAAPGYGRAVLRALRSPGYRLFWSGSFVSNVGFWMQSVALGWLVYDLTRRASLLGTISFCGNVPFIALGLLGGAVADRASRRAVMLGAQVVLAAAALTLAGLTASGHIAVWHVVAIAMVAGTASALYAPVMQAVIPSLVDP